MYDWLSSQFLKINSLNNTICTEVSNALLDFNLLEIVLATVMLVKLIDFFFFTKTEVFRILNTPVIQILKL